MRSKNIESTTLKVPEKYSRPKYKKAQYKPKAISNLDVTDSVAGSPKDEAKVEVKVTPKPLQLQVQEEVPKFKRVTRSNIKKAMLSKEKGTVTVYLDHTEAKEILKQSPISFMANNTLDPQKSPKTLVLDLTPWP